MAETDLNISDNIESHICPHRLLMEFDRLRCITVDYRGLANFDVLKGVAHMFNIRNRRGKTLIIDIAQASKV